MRAGNGVRGREPIATANPKLRSSRDAVGTGVEAHGDFDGSMTFASIGGHDMRRSVALFTRPVVNLSGCSEGMTGFASPAEFDVVDGPSVDRDGGFGTPPAPRGEGHGGGRHGHHQTQPGRARQAPSLHDADGMSSRRVDVPAHMERIVRRRQSGGTGPVHQKRWSLAKE